MTSKYVSRHISCYGVSHEGKYCTFNKILVRKKSQTPVRGQDGKISDTRGKDFYWSPTRRSLVGDQKSFPWVSEIFPSCTLTGVRSFISCTSVRQKYHVRFTGKCMLYSLCQLSPQFSILFLFKINNSLYISFQSYINTQILTISHIIT